VASAIEVAVGSIETKEMIVSTMTVDRVIFKNSADFGG
jgi:hypothetical protein